MTTKQPPAPNPAAAPKAAATAPAAPKPVVTAPAPAPATPPAAVSTADNTDALTVGGNAGDFTPPTDGAEGKGKKAADKDGVTSDAKKTGKGSGEIYTNTTAGIISIRGFEFLPGVATEVPAEVAANENQMLRIKHAAKNGLLVKGK